MKITTIKLIYREIKPSKKTEKFLKKFTQSIGPGKNIHSDGVPEMFKKEVIRHIENTKNK